MGYFLEMDGMPVDQPTLDLDAEVYDICVDCGHEITGKSYSRRCKWCAASKYLGV